MIWRDAKIIKEYAEFVVKHKRKRLTNDDWRIIGKDLKTTTKLRHHLTRKIVMSNLELANQTILNILTRNGIDQDKPFKLYNEAERIAKSKENSKDLISIADRYVELLDMKPKHTQTSIETQQVSYVSMLEDGNKGKITATKTTKQLDMSTNDDSSTHIESDNV